jgi:predicted transcriptional regulator of viral defense system
MITSEVLVRSPRQLPSVFSYSEARAQGYSDHALRRLRAEGAIELLSRGVYRRTDVATAEIELSEIVLRAPRATLCLTTALSRHDLTDTIPNTIDVALPHGTWLPTLSAPVTWHKFARATFEIGRETVRIDNHRIGLYDAQRSIVDTFRLRHLEGYELAIDALKRWLRKRGSQPSALLAMAHRVDPRSEAALRRAMEIIL